MKEKVILFDGTSLDGFVSCATGEKAEWEVRDGAMTVVPGKGDIRSIYEYSDAHVHVEFNLPYMPEMTGQDRGNSGVYVQGCYEIQVLDSSMNAHTNCCECGGIYELANPIKNMCKEPGVWQTYDIILRSARYNEDGSLKSHAIITLLHNGEVIHNNVTLTSRTPGGCYRYIAERGPVMLQDHDCPVQYRNIWVQPLD